LDRVNNFTGRIGSNTIEAANPENHWLDALMEIGPAALAVVALRVM
jgi:hypothetical protein